MHLSIFGHSLLLRDELRSPADKDSSTYVILVVNSVEYSCFEASLANGALDHIQLFVRVLRRVILSEVSEWVFSVFLYNSSRRALHGTP